MRACRLSKVTRRRIKISASSPDLDSGRRSWRTPSGGDGVSDWQDLKKKKERKSFCFAINILYCDHFKRQCDVHFYWNVFPPVTKQEEARWIRLKVGKGKIHCIAFSQFIVVEHFEGIVLEECPDKKHFPKSAVWFGNRILWPFYLLRCTSQPPQALHCKKSTYE